MRFNRKRGRPALNRPKRDKGTPELARKRRLGITEEPIDYLLKRGFIDDNQHWAGTHFRWLHSILFGVQKLGLKCYDGGSDSSERDDEWRKRKEIRYSIASEALILINKKELIIELCVNHNLPLAISLLENNKQDEIISALDSLLKVWKMV